MVMSGNIFSLCKRLVISQSLIRSAFSAFIVTRFVLPVIVLLMIADITGRAQIVYSQNFNSTTLAGSGWTNTNLTVPWSSGSYLGFFSNNWYVNDAESGMPPNTCGTAGAGNPTLYMGAVGLGALGAAYVANAQTNRRISSPNINTTGYSGMTLSFNFIANGAGSTDKAYFQYSVDGGTTWIIPAGVPTSTTPALQAGSNWSNLKSQVCGSGQGRWTNVTWAMPAACENISNLRIAFVWQNGNTTSGATDPCLAVDDIVISVILAPVVLSAFEVRCENSMAVLEWTTRSENNNDFFTLETSTDLVHWQMLTRVSGSGNSGDAKYYSFRHPAPGFVVYYKLSQTDFDGRDTPLRIISLTDCIKNSGFSIYPNPASDFINIRGDNPAAIHSIRIYDRFGRLVVNSAAGNYEGSQIQYRFPSSIAPGLYIVYVQTAEGEVEEFKLMVE